jgi:hypothetical protein
MTRRSHHRSPLLPHLPALALAISLMAGLLLAGPARDAESSPSPTSTVEPLPGPAVAMELEGLQKQTRGGIASFRLRVDAGPGAGSFVVTAKAPAGTVFADGSTSKTWSAERGQRLLPFELIASEDGTFVVSVEMTGTIRGKALRRATAYRLLVGVDESLPEARHGAIEFASATSEGGSR